MRKKIETAFLKMTNLEVEGIITSNLQIKVQKSAEIRTKACQMMMGHISHHIDTTLERFYVNFQKNILPINQPCQHWSDFKTLFCYS